MEWNSKSAKTLFALVGFGVLLFWGLENLPLLGSIFGWIFALLAPFILGGAIAFALGVDYLLPREWFTESLTAIAASCHTHTPWFNILCTGILLALLVNALVRRFVRKTTHEECGCGGACHEAEPVEQEAKSAERAYIVTGMHCNHCRNSVMRTVGSLPGVEAVEVDLQSGRMTVSGTAEPGEVVQAVDALGFGAKEAE